MNSQSLKSAPVYSTECISATTAQIRDENGKVIATIDRPVTLAKIRAATEGIKIELTLSKAMLK